VTAAAGVLVVVAGGLEVVVREPRSPFNIWDGG
jgi:hypothetical protein